MSPLLLILLLFFVLYLVSEFLSRSKRLAAILFGVLPILLIPIWMKSFVIDPFVWAKVFSVCAVAVFISLLTLKEERKLKKWVQWMVYLSLAINIGEAVIKDVTMNMLPSYLNALAGLLLILNLKKSQSLRIEKKRGVNKLLWPDLSPMFILAYTLWNFTFVYLNYNGFALRHIAVLLVPVLANHLVPGSWYQMRAFSLGILLIFAITFDTWMSNLNVPLPAGPILTLAMSIISLYAGLLLSLSRFIKRA